jgi:hypothetical protein
LLFIIDDIFTYDVYESNKYLETVHFQVKMNEMGEFYLEDVQSNKLYFNNTATQFYFYHYEGEESYLKVLFILAPRIPFINQKDISFVDYLPVNLLRSKKEVLVIGLLSTLNKKFAKIEQEYHYENQKISSPRGEVTLSGNAKGFSTLSYQSISLKRTELAVGNIEVT